ncbi:MAG: peptidase S16 [Alphaproteobacteria bacterium]|jgi:Lon protease-like protein|nr:peptidase S16 [Alphaproteobacteria bacterium]PPR14032.1 MAG: Lon protease [Alphaproteobacteria bacterium MarineAlpha12_Bin1]|tara:strand:- start:4164 stop:4841 length:678 start_codon:yes stop_codon:yes gene_type:complete
MTSKKFEIDFHHLPQELPLFPLVGVLLLPRGLLPLNIFEPRYLHMFEYALSNQRLIGISQPTIDGVSGLSAPDNSELYKIGCAGRITSFQETREGQIQITLRGVCRFVINSELPLMNGFRRANTDFKQFEDDYSEETMLTSERDRLLSGLQAYFKMENMEADWETIKKTPDDRLVTSIAMVCPFEPHEKQAILESKDLTHRCKLVIGLIESALRIGDDSAPTTIN